jgi:hypothetical protein
MLVRPVQLLEPCLRGPSFPNALAAEGTPMHTPCKWADPCSASAGPNRPQRARLFRSQQLAADNRHAILRCPAFSYISTRPIDPPLSSDYSPYTLCNSAACCGGHLAPTQHLAHRKGAASTSSPDEIPSTSGRLVSACANRYALGLCCEEQRGGRCVLIVVIFDSSSPKLRRTSHQNRMKAHGAADAPSCANRSFHILII